jgi:hypothetical protein
VPVRAGTTEVGLQRSSAIPFEVGKSTRGSHIPVGVSILAGLVCERGVPWSEVLRQEDGLGE